MNRSITKKFVTGIEMSFHRATKNKLVWLVQEALQHVDLYQMQIIGIAPLYFSVKILFVILSAMVASLFKRNANVMMKEIAFGLGVTEILVQNEMNEFVYYKKSTTRKVKLFS